MAADKNPTNGVSNLKKVPFCCQNRSFPSRLWLSIRCAAKKETVDKVCEIVRNQLSLGDDVAITGDSQISKLGADSLDQVEIVMQLEESFDIRVDEGSVERISTVEDAAELVDKFSENS